MLSVSELEVLYNDSIVELDSILECRPMLYELRLLLTESYNIMLEYYKSSTTNYSINKLDNLKSDVIEIIDVIYYNIHGTESKVDYVELYKHSTDYYIKIDVLRNLLIGL